jgi:hypothetical protein
MAHLVPPAKRVVNRLFAATTSGWGDRTGSLAAGPGSGAAPKTAQHSFALQVRGFAILEGETAASRLSGPGAGPRPRRLSTASPSRCGDSRSWRARLWRAVFLVPERGRAQDGSAPGSAKALHRGKHLRPPGAGIRDLGGRDCGEPSFWSRSGSASPMSVHFSPAPEAGPRPRRLSTRLRQSATPGQAPSASRCGDSGFWRARLWRAVFPVPERLGFTEPVHFSPAPISGAAPRTAQHSFALQVWRFGILEGETVASRLSGPGAARLHRAGSFLAGPGSGAAPKTAQRSFALQVWRFGILEGKTVASRLSGPGAARLHRAGSFLAGPGSGAAPAQTPRARGVG